MFCQLFPLISDVSMCDKFPEEAGDDDLNREGLDTASKPSLLSSLEMRRVLSEAENTDNTDEEEEVGNTLETTGILIMI